MRLSRCFEQATEAKPKRAEAKEDFGFGKSPPRGSNPRGVALGPVRAP